MLSRKTGHGHVIAEAKDICIPSKGSPRTDSEGVPRGAAGVGLAVKVILGGPTSTVSKVGTVEVYQGPRCQSISFDGSVMLDGTLDAGKGDLSSYHQGPP